MECYEGAKMIKTFRGLITDGDQDTILLHTNDGATGYRIVKFQLMAKEAGTTEYEHIVKIYKTSKATVDAEVDFSESTLLAAAYLEGNSGEHYSDQQTVIFDNEIFNQDIYVTHQDIKADPGKDCNYYFELEQVGLNENESAMATLQSLRTVASR